MGQRPGQRQPLGLTAGKPDAAGAHPGLQPLRHGRHFAVQTHSPEVVHGIARVSQQHIFPDRAAEQLRIVAQIPHEARQLPGGQLRQLSAVQPDAAAVGLLAEERLAQRGFAAGHRPGDADDLPPAGGQIQAGEQRRVAGIAAGEVPDLQTLHPAGGNGGLGGDLPHQGLDAFPGHLRLVDCVEQLRRLGGFGGQLGKAGQKRGEFRDGPDRPAGAQHVFPAEIQDQRRPDHGEHPVQRRQGRCPQVCLYSGVFVSGEVLLIGCPALLLPAKDPVGQGVDRPIHGGGVQDPGLLLEGRAGALDGPLHPFRQRVAPRQKGHGQQRQPPVIPQQHPGIGCQGHAGVKYLRGEFPHSLGAVVHVGNGLGQHRSRALTLQVPPIRPDQRAVQDPLHTAVYLVGKAPDIEPLQKPKSLHRGDDGDVPRRQRDHDGKAVLSQEDPGQRFRHLSLEPRACHQTYIIEETRHGDDRQHPGFCPEIGADPVRRKLSLTHGAPPLPAPSGP